MFTEPIKYTIWVMIPSADNSGYQLPGFLLLAKMN